MMSLHECFLLLGSNLGDRNFYLLEAKKYLSEEAGIIQQTSGIYETAPWGFETQPSFLNQVLVLKTGLSPEILMQTLLAIENKMGRIRDEKMGPRTIDIDILLYDEIVYDSPTLSIPHPRLHMRRFVLLPLSEINASKNHPRLKQSVGQLLSACQDPLSVQKIDSVIHNS